MGVKVTNNAFGTLSASINTSDTTVTLDTGQGARFPTLGSGDYFYGTIIDTSNNLEIVKATARSTDSLTVVRAQDNTTARAFAIGDRFELRPTAALFGDIDIRGSGGTISGAIDIESSAQEILHATGTNANQVRMKIENTTSGVDYAYYEAKTDNGSGYLIHNGTGLGNNLASGETYVWSNPGKVSLIPGGNIAKKLEVATNGNVSINGKLYGGGLVLLGQSSWTSNTTGAIFDVFDYTKYSNYILTWTVSHAPNWNHTYFRFRNSSGDITANDYHGVAAWYGSQQTDSHPTYNTNGNYGGQRDFIWMAGNGTSYASQGMAIISIPHDGSWARAQIRGDSQLIHRTSTTHYLEQFSGALTVNPSHTTVTGCHIYGSGGNSQYGSFEIFGVERG
tara:strand:- start:2784 stop:3962 length:1179 start_codon:yes stop_codon:yes gene_type:complete